MAQTHQQTLTRKATLSGIGLHTGQPVRLTLKPAPVHSGIVFRRTDLPGRPEIAAHWQNVTPSPLCTTLTNDDGTSVGTIEHLMAALAALGIDNAVVDLDGPEVPILDGSSAPFLAALTKAGITRQPAPRAYLRVMRPVCFAEGDKRVQLLPSLLGQSTFDLSVQIDFPSAAIGRQEAHLRLSPAAFQREVAFARTFGFASEVERMRTAGLGRGGSLDNAVVIDGDTVLNPEGFHVPDECVRHKLLDAVGDLSLAGFPLIGRFVGEKCGHYLNYRLLEALFGDEDNYTLETFERVQPVQRQREMALVG